MGNTTTTFCNESKVFVHSELAVATPYYKCDLAPEECKDFTVGRVWFTVTTELSDRAGNLYFPVSENLAAGLLSENGVEKFDHVDLSASEAHQIINSPSDVIVNDFPAVSQAIYNAKNKLSASKSNYYANSNRKISITGGPKAVIHKEHPRHPGKIITILPVTFDGLKMNI